MEYLLYVGVGGAFNAAMNEVSAAVRAAGIGSDVVRPNLSYWSIRSANRGACAMLTSSGNSSFQS